MSLLLAVLRLLWSKTGYDEVTRAECQPAIDGVFKCLASEDHTVSYPAALVVRSAFVGGVLMGAGVGVHSGQKARRGFAGCRYSPPATCGALQQSVSLLRLFSVCIFAVVRILVLRLLRAELLLSILRKRGFAELSYMAKPRCLVCCSIGGADIFLGIDILTRRKLLSCLTFFFASRLSVVAILIYLPTHIHINFPIPNHVPSACEKSHVHADSIPYACVQVRIHPLFHDQNALFDRILVYSISVYSHNRIRTYP